MLGLSNTQSETQTVNIDLFVYRAPLSPQMFPTRIMMGSFPFSFNNLIFFPTGTKRDSKQDNRLYINLPPHRQEEMERLLQEGGGRGWRQLGAALGYEPEQLDLFGRGEAPAHTLLSNWAQKEGSTLGLLCSALARIERPDVVTVLNCPTQGVSVV